MVPTAPDKLKLINVAHDHLRDTMLSLYDRWLDEHEYEDFSDYVRAMRTKLLEYIPDAEFLQATKRPFGFTFALGDKRYQFKITAYAYSWRRTA